MRKSLVAIAVVVVLGSIITFCIVIQNKDKKDMVLPPEIVQVSKEFKDKNTPPQSLSRNSLAVKLAPYIKKGMSKAQTIELLGEPPSKNTSTKIWHYDTSLGTSVGIHFDDQGKVLRVDGTGVVSQ